MIILLLFIIQSVFLVVLLKKDHSNIADNGEKSTQQVVDESQSLSDTNLHVDDDVLNQVKYIAGIIIDDSNVLRGENIRKSI